MDIDFMFYVYTCILNKSEEEFWRSTPRKIFALFDIHNKRQKAVGSKKSNKEDSNIVKGETVRLKAVK